MAKQEEAEQNIYEVSPAGEYVTITRPNGQIVTILVKDVFDRLDAAQAKKDQFTAQYNKNIAEIDSQIAIHNDIASLVGLSRNVESRKASTIDAPTTIDAPAIDD